MPAGLRTKRTTLRIRAAALVCGFGFDLPLVHLRAAADRAYTRISNSKKEWNIPEIFVKIRLMHMKPEATNETLGQEIRFGRFRLDPINSVLWRDEKLLPLGPKVVNTLALLVSRRGEVVSRQEIIREVWGDTVVEDNSLAHNIFVLRKMLKEGAADGFSIETVPRRGYRFCSAEAPEPAETVGPVPVQPLRRSRILQLAVACGVLLVLGVTSLHLAGTRTRKTETRPIVAVVGFVNLSDQPSTAWVSPALSEMMTTELAAGGQLLMIADETVARARFELKLEDRNGFSADTLSKLRRDLHADVVVSGAYTVIPPQQLGPETGPIRLDLRIQETNSGKTMDAISEVGDQSNLFEMVARAGSRLRKDLGASSATPQQEEQARLSVSANSQALRLYAEGVAKLRTYDDLGARELLQQALRADPNYAAAHFALSDTLSDLGYEQNSQEEAKIAFELSGRLSPTEQLSSAGRYQMSQGNWEKAIEIYGKLVTEFPDNLDYGLQLATAQLRASKGKDALESLRLLRSYLSPSRLDARIELKEYEAWKALGDFSHMEAALEQAVDAAKQQGALLLLARARIRQCWVQRFLAQPQQALSNCREAQEVYTVTHHLRGQAEALRLLANMVSSSDVTTAFDYLHQALALDRQTGSLVDLAMATNDLATLQSGQGDHAGAKKLYEEVVVLSKQTGDALTAAGMMNNIAGELKAMGELQPAKKMYMDTLAAGKQMSNSYVIGIAEYNIGDLEQLQGELDNAEQSFQQAAASFQQTGIKQYDILINKSLGELAALRGDLPNARKLYEQALSLQKAPQQRLEAAEAKIGLAQLSLENGEVASAIEPVVRESIEVFRTGSASDDPNAADDRALSLSLLARCLSSEGRTAAALQTIEQAVVLSNKAAPDVRMNVAVTAGRLRFAAQGNRGEQIMKNLASTASEAHRLGYIGAELEARLALGEMEIQSGENARGRSRLQAVEKEASRRRFAVVAKRAREANQIAMQRVSGE